MNNAGKNVTRWMAVLAVAHLGLLFASVGDVHAADVDCHNAPMVKNLRSYTAHCAPETTQPQPLSKKEVKKLLASAKSPEDHLKLADYYKTQADWLDAEGAQYEKAAAEARSAPQAKNLVAPTTASRYEEAAHKFRKEAETDRALAASQREMAKAAAAKAAQ